MTEIIWGRLRGEVREGMEQVPKNFLLDLHKSNVWLLSAAVVGWLYEL